MICIAHRGDRKFPENTKAAFDAAIQKGCLSMELDLVSLKDGQVVIFHDDNLLRFFHDRRMVKDLTLQEFRSINPDLMTFHEFVERYKDASIEINLEIKDSDKTLSSIADRIRELKNPVISSFRRDIVTKAISMGWKGAYLFEGALPLLWNYHSLCSNRIHINKEVLLGNSLLNILCKSLLKNKDVYCYTVNQKGDAIKLQSMPFVKGIFTDTLLDFEPRNKYKFANKYI